MTDKHNKGKKTHRTVDLSSGEPRKKKVTSGMAAPVVQETINLSTPKNEKTAATPGPGKPKESTPKKRTRKNKPSQEEKQSGGTSLAELLDPETLARLKETS